MKKAFTLAEVLITLGIIGVVAAMTMPSLIQNYQKKVYVNQLKKSVVTIDNAFSKMLADSETDSLFDTDIWKKLPPPVQPIIYDLGDGGDFEDELKNYMNCEIKEMDLSLKQLNGKSTGSDSQYVCTFNTGATMLYFGISGIDSCGNGPFVHGSLCSMIGELGIDVNGKRNPNTYGRDIFVFVIGNDGKIYPKYGNIDFSAGSNYWKDYPTCDPNQNNSFGDGCAARIIENGWVMDY